MDANHDIDRRGLYNIGAQMEIHQQSHGMRRKAGEVSDIFITMDSNPADEEERLSYVDRPAQLSKQTKRRLRTYLGILHEDNDEEHSTLI